MASQQCASIGLVIALAATIGISFTLISRYWQISSMTDSQQIYTGMVSYAGLWVRCVSYGQGQFQCDKYGESYIGLPASLNTQRAFMVIAVILIYPGNVCGFLSMKSVEILDLKSKMYSARASGGMILAAGALTVISTTWYAILVVQQYYEDRLNDSDFVYQFGSALYVGWVTGSLAIIAGFLMLCCSENEFYDEDEYRYNPPKSQRQREYRENEEEYV